MNQVIASDQVKSGDPLESRKTRHASFREDNMTADWEFLLSQATLREPKEEVVEFASVGAQELAARWVNLVSRITTDPDRLSGVPCVRDMRIPVSMILSGLAEGMTPDQIVGLYPSLEPDDILAACAYAAEFIERFGAVA